MIELMSFEEIAQRLGISRKAAWIHYQNAMRKIRRRPASLRRLQDAVNERQQLQDRRLASGFGVERC